MNKDLPKADDRIEQYSRRDSSHDKMAPLTLVERRRLGLSVAAAGNACTREEAAADVLADMLGKPERAGLILQDEDYFHTCYRQAAKNYHPDRPDGNVTHMTELNRVKDILQSYFDKQKPH